MIFLWKIKDFGAVFLLVATFVVTGTTSFYLFYFVLFFGWLACKGIHQFLLVDCPNARTVVLGVELGITISLAISVLWIIKKTSLPHLAILGKVPNTNKYKDISQFTNAKPMEVRVASCISNCYYSYFRCAPQQLLVDVDRSFVFGLNILVAV